MMSIQTTGDDPDGSKVIQRLDALRTKNANPNWVNNDLYRLLYKEDLYIIAYERIKSSAGNMTPGIDPSTLDGFSMVSIENIIKEMRNESFKFSRARRVNIPKANGGTRPLGVATPRDKIVQEVIRLILNTIYESPYGATFKQCSHGFRPGKGTHTALHIVRTDWQAMAWIIEGDIKACFDTIPHDKLMNVLRKRISDERFLNLIRKALNAGYMEFKTPINSIVGTPQGSVVSPLLANIYLHELDEFVENTIKPKHERPGQKRLPPPYRKILRNIKRIRDQLDSKTGEERKILVKNLHTERSALLRENPVAKGSGPIRVKYVRYADDWMIGVDGPQDIAQTIREEISIFLKEKMGLTLSMEKTHIRHAKTEEAFFLGTRIKIGSTSRRIQTITIRGRKIPKRVTGWQPLLLIPVQKIVSKLAMKGFCDPQGKPTHKGAWEILDDDQIVELYSSVMRGLSNYYSFAANYAALGRIQYILKYSLAMTLASKHKSSITKVFKKYGDPPRVSVMSDGKKVRTIRFFQPDSYSVDTLRFNIKDQENELDALISTQYKLRTRSKLGKHCCICGETKGISMHHIRHVRKMGQKITGFNRLMATINRKQIPVCHPCHMNIHNGRYDGKELGSFFDPELATA